MANLMPGDGLVNCPIAFAFLRGARTSTPTYRTIKVESSGASAPDHPDEVTTDRRHTTVSGATLGSQLAERSRVSADQIASLPPRPRPYVNLASQSLCSGFDVADRGAAATRREVCAEAFGGLP